MNSNGPRETKSSNALLYRPKPVAPRSELLERVDLGDIIREKSSSRPRPSFACRPTFSIRRAQRDRLPAIIDLHSHGGMIPFGKEKVTDLVPGIIL